MINAIISRLSRVLKEILKYNRVTDGIEMLPLHSAISQDEAVERKNLYSRECARVDVQLLFCLTTGNSETMRLVAIWIRELKGTETLGDDVMILENNEA